MNQLTSDKPLDRRGAGGRQFIIWPVGGGQRSRNCLVRTTR